MKVITQLIRHFWQRGALTPLEVAYLRRHGFCRAQDVPGFKAPKAGEDLAWDALARGPVQMPDGLELLEETLIRRTTPRRKSFQPKVKQLDEKELLRRVNAEYTRRAADLESVLALGQQIEEVEDWPTAASRLHAAPPDRFHRGLRGGLRADAVLIGDLWQATDPEPFHGFLDAQDFRGRPARAFQAVLVASSAAQLGQFAWILKHEEVQALVNLLYIHQQLLTSLQKLYKRDRPLLARAIKRNNDPAQLWSLVLLYNAYRNPKLGFEPDYDLEYGPVKPPKFGVWKRAWTCALRMDRAAVTKFLATCYAGNDSEDVDEGMYCQHPLMCPVGWNLPDEN